MDMQTLMSYEWGIMAPEFTIIGAGILLSLLDLFMAKEKDRKFLAWVGLIGIFIALLFVIDQLDYPQTAILADTYRLDSFAKAFKIILLVGTGLVFLLATAYQSIVYKGEFYYLMLTALLGAMMMSSSADMITLFVGLELLSISSYILVGIKRDSGKANEAAIKYVISGGIASSFILFGMSYVYGFTGSTNLYEMSAQLQQVSTNHMLIMMMAYLFIFVGLSFKMATVPFHMWAPDVYEGAVTPITAFLSVVSKAAGFIILTRFLIIVFYQTSGIGGSSLLSYMQVFVGLVAGLTMVIGNTIALRQKNVKRLFAYSSIAHAGYLLVPFVSLSAFMFEGLWFYLVAYVFMNIGVFAIVQTVTAQSGNEHISSFKGLYERSPFIAVLMTIFLLSLAGIPGTAGFFGKWTIFLGAFTSQSAHYGLISVMLATTVISYVYYFGLMKQIFFGKCETETTVKLPKTVTAVVLLCAFGTILFGIMPNIALDFFYAHFPFVDFFG